jgi:hypothetical protein
MVPWGIEFYMKPWRPIFEKCSHLREKGEVLMLFKTTPHLEAKAQYTKFGSVCKFAAVRRATNYRWRSHQPASTKDKCIQIYPPPLVQ